MKRFALIVAIVCLFARPAMAHRLDEYLQAAILSIEPGTVTINLRLVPGVAVAPAVIAGMDRNGDGVLSATEQHVYAERVMADLVLKEDGHPLKLRLVNAAFPAIAQMNAGTGEIEIVFAADLPAGHGSHELTFENHHQSGISVYLVNTLVPKDRSLRIDEQNRNQNQSTYELSFTQLDFAQSTSGNSAYQGFNWSGFSGAFRLGVKHIAEGTDHLLFLLTLLLPAPLLAYAGRWSGPATVHRSLVQILRIVTAFTLGHSLTLALAGFGLVRLPSRPVEILIAVSILVSALHAFRPLFPGKEAVIAAFFGLIHGLAFASALSGLGFTGWYRLISVLGFNLGIEAMQLVVVAVTLPSLLLLSRTVLYAAFRISGALFAAVASVGWIVERVSDRPNVVGSFAGHAAQNGKLIAAGLFLCSLLAWLLERSRGGAFFVQWGERPE